jgi:hypothetical protein
MPKTKGQKAQKQGQDMSRHTSSEDTGRYPTPGERADILDDAKEFKKKHEKTFRILERE